MGKALSFLPSFARRFAVLPLHESAHVPCKVSKGLDALRCFVAVCYVHMHQPFDPQISAGFLDEFCSGGERLERADRMSDVLVSDVLEIAVELKQVPFGILLQEVLFAQLVPCSMRVATHVSYESRRPEATFHEVFSYGCCR